jgi:dTDP-4-amino-4,6-dideoxygalactose transaminase
VARGYPIALPDLPPLADRIGEDQDGMPGARRLAHDLITMPLHNRLTSGDIDALAAWVGTV